MTLCLADRARGALLQGGCAGQWNFFLKRTWLELKVAISGVEVCDFAEDHSVVHLRAQRSLVSLQLQRMFKYSPDFPAIESLAFSRKGKLRSSLILHSAICRGVGECVHLVPTLLLSIGNVFVPFRPLHLELFFMILEFMELDVTKLVIDRVRRFGSSAEISIEPVGQNDCLCHVEVVGEY